MQNIHLDLGLFVNTIGKQPPVNVTDYHIDGVIDTLLGNDSLVPNLGSISRYNRNQKAGVKDAGIQELLPISYCQGDIIGPELSTKLPPAA